ncbi:MAG: iron-sulfur cluster assembly scaffold protein [Desulfobacterales bacterium]|nr:iron-sulfur cluster assembly scaffold protein [Desulfobacterales bacterium]MBF0397520.1 iron-sulfur cluster assembly scaffold protein [Desulfobacterales bacterium]
MEPKKNFDFIGDHSMRFLDMALRMDRLEIITDPDGYGKRTGDCGDTVEMFLKVSGDTLSFVSFNIDGCINTHACANAVVNLVEGKKIDEAWEINVEKVVNYLETLPHEKIHCAELAVGALYLALKNFQELSKSPWKKMYQKQ